MQQRDLGPYPGETDHSSPRTVTVDLRRGATKAAPGLGQVQRAERVRDEPDQRRHAPTARPIMPTADAMSST